MKRMIIALVAMFMMTFTTASAMSYEQARQQALFLTDKMAYELNLTEDQYEAAYEVNLDYLMSVDTYDDLYGAYWRQRNMDLSYILLDWQYRTYLNATYFYRPLYWNAGYWHFGIYARYPRRDFFYFGRAHFYVSYRGGHSWRVNGNRSWYYGRSFGGPHPGGHRGNLVSRLYLYRWTEIYTLITILADRTKCSRAHVFLGSSRRGRHVLSISDPGTKGKLMWAEKP